MGHFYSTERCDNLPADSSLKGLTHGTPIVVEDVAAFSLTTVACGGECGHVRASDLSLSYY